MSNNVKQTYPAITLRNMVVFPTEKASVALTGDDVLKGVRQAFKKDQQVILVFQKNSHKSPIGTLVNVLQHWDIGLSTTALIIEGLRRVKIQREFLEEGIRLAEVSEIPIKEFEDEKEKTNIEALARSTLEQFKKLIQFEGLVPLTIIEDLQKEYLTPEQTSDLVSSVLKLDFSEELRLLETVDIRKRLELLDSKLIKELNIVQTEKKINHEIEKELNQVQKELILRERLKAIEKELGIFEEQKEFNDLEQKILHAGLPKEAEKRVLGEFSRLRQMPAISPEAPYIKTYLEWIVELPWSKKDNVTVDLIRAKIILDKDHYGLEKTKERVLEYLAVQKLTGGKGRGSILCFVGPPGTGKTSVGQSIAKALGRKFVRLSFGGIRDEAEIRGHRRTYVGALPGRIIQGMRNAGTKNPVFMIDEVDKIGADFRGDPAAALLEVLDPAQNNSFSDHYIEIPFDLSEVFFIMTANVLDPIPPALGDRMEAIEFPGYTIEEKFNIGKNFLLPRVLKNHGLTDKQLILTDDAIMEIVSKYTRESGVRELERKLSEIARKVAKKIVEGRMSNNIILTEDNLVNYLGSEEYDSAVVEEKNEVGVATGLAWTPAGGEIIFIEANLVPGKGNLTLTGQLGEVMQESVKAALSYIRSRASKLGFPDNFYYSYDIHVHVPSGAIPKDGPSAGIAMATALASILTNQKVKKDVALTGEITLSGKVLKVGGIKEKVLAASRAGVKTIILPIGNKKNLNDIPDEVRKRLNFHFVKHMDEALSRSLVSKASFFLKDSVKSSFVKKQL